MSSDSPFDRNLVQLQDLFEFGNVAERYELGGVGFALNVSLEEEAVDHIDLRFVAEPIRQYYTLSDVKLACSLKMSCYSFFKLVSYQLSHSRSTSRPAKSLEPSPAATPRVLGRFLSRERIRVNEFD